MSRRYLTPARLKSLDAQLSSRDRAVLTRVSELRFVSGSQLARMHFADASARATRRALLRLVGLGVLERLPRNVGGVRGGSAGFVYQLAPAGQRLVRRTWRPHVPGTLFLSHALQVAELHSLLVEADRAGQLELLELLSEPACWRTWSGAALKPDSYVRLGAGDFEDSYFIEVDMGTEGSRALEHKLRDYLAYGASGLEQARHGVFPKVLWLVPDGQRVTVIRDCIERRPRSSWQLFEVSQFKDAVSAVIAPIRRFELGGGVVTASRIEGIGKEEIYE